MQELTFTVVICNIEQCSRGQLDCQIQLCQRVWCRRKRRKRKKKPKKGIETVWTIGGDLRFSFSFSFFFLFFFFFWLLLNCRHVFSTGAVSLLEYVNKDFVLEGKFLSRGCRDETMNVCYEGFDNKVYIPNLTNFHLVEVFWRGRQQKQRNLNCFVFHAFFFVYLCVSLFLRKRRVLQARGANLALVKVFCS